MESGPTSPGSCAPRQYPPVPPAANKGERVIRGEIRAQWEQEWKSSTKGGHLRKIDNNLPATYTQKLYGSLSRGRAYLLTQLRMGHNWLSTYRKNIGYSDDNQCVCGAQETVTHVLVDCLRLVELRRKLRTEVGTRSIACRVC